MTLHRPLALLFLAAMSLPLAAQTSLPPGEDLLGGSGPNAFGLQLLPGTFDAVHVEVVPVEGAPGFTDALRFESLRDLGPPFAVQLRAMIRRPLAKGDVGLVRFYARAISSADESGAGRIAASVQRGLGFGRGAASETFSPSGEWTEFLMPFWCERDYGPFEGALTFSLGFRKQTLEIGGLDVLYYGTKVAFNDIPRTRFTYAGREADAPWRKAALERIEKIRKGDITVNVVDASGKPVKGATVKLKETRGAFQFGTAIPFRRLVTDSPDNKIFREKVLKLFTEASPENDLKWPAWLDDFESGSYGKEQAMAGLKWLRDHDFTVRGHVLVWPGRRNLPKIIADRLGTPQQDEIPGLVREHIRELGEATRDWLVEWDVLNEPYTNHDLMDVFGPQIMVDWFKTAREAMPNVALYFNDFSNQDQTTDAKHVEHFEKTTRYLLDQGAPVDGLGLQAHIGGVPNAPENVLATLDRYWNEFRLPVRFTEFDINTSDDELQADYTRDFFTLAFSHPSVVGIQLWGFWEGSHWIPAGAMYREDWSEKPNAAVYKQLVLHDWLTNEALVTGANGTIKIRGFYGDYRVTVEANGKSADATFKLSAGGPATVDVRMP